MLKPFLEHMLNTPMFGFCLSILLYEIGVWIQAKTGSPVANPLLIAGVAIIAFLKVTGISYETYNDGGRFITMFLSPCTAVLAVNIYANRATIKKYLLPILCGTAAAAATSMFSVHLLCRAFGLSEELRLSLLPKSVTTAISMPLVQMTGGIDSILVGAVMLTGICTAICAPAFIKLFRIKDPVAAGIAIGSAGHGAGTAAAIKIGPTEGATAGIAIGMSGLFTVLYYSFLFTVN